MVSKNMTLNMKHHLKVRVNFFQIWKNGTTTIQIGSVTDKLNIRRVKPYNSMEVD